MLNNRELSLLSLLSQFPKTFNLSISTQSYGKFQNRGSLTPKILANYRSRLNPFEIK